MTISSNDAVIAEREYRDKVKCEKCKYNGYLVCKKFKSPKYIKNEFTGDKVKENKNKFTIWKSELNDDGKCLYYKKGFSLIAFLLNKL